MLVSHQLQDRQSLRKQHKHIAAYLPKPEIVCSIQAGR